jgi:pilus assembly protein CpaD
MFFAAMAALAGCTPEATRLSTVEVPKENKVDFLSLTHPVHFQPGSMTLADGEDKSLAQFVATVSPRYGDDVTVDATANSAERPALRVQRLNSVARRLQGLGIQASASTQVDSEFTAPRDEVVVRVGRYVVTAPKCPDWSAPEAADFTNTPPSNFGCATTANLGLMVANPADLVRGAATGGADAGMLARAVERYRVGARAKSSGQGSGESAAGGSDNSGGGGQGGN